MSKTAHLNELVPPLVLLLVLAIHNTALESAHDLERIEKLIDGFGVKNLVPNLFVVVHGVHPRQLFDFLVELLVNRQLLQEVPCGLNQMRLGVLA